MWKLIIHCILHIIIVNSFLFVEYQILLFSLIVINPWNLVHHERHRQQEKFWVGIKTTKSNVNKHLTICLSTKINLIPAEINETTCILKKNIFLILYLHGISSLSYGDGKYIKKITMFHAWLRNNYDILLTKIYFVWLL